MRLRRVVTLMPLVIAASHEAQAPRPPLPNQLVVGTDTMSSYVRGSNGLTQSREFVVRVVTGSAAAGYTASIIWYDSVGAWNTTGEMKTEPGRMLPAFDVVRATTDSAAVSFKDGLETGWVVPSREGARLVNGAAPMPRYSRQLAQLAIAASKPKIGSVFVADLYNLYGPSPLAARPDTFLVAGRQTLRDRGRDVQTLRITANGGRSIVWAEENTGRILMEQGTISPTMSWVHARRGVEVPASP